MKYSVTAGTLTVTATSSLHDTTTTWSKIDGSIDADPDTLASAGAAATFTVDMTAFDAGDWLKNRKLRKDFDMDAHPRATFTLSKVHDVVRDGSAFTAKAEGTLSWRGKQVVLAVTGSGTLDPRTVTASGEFELDITRLGLAAPRFLMIKMSDQVRVKVAFSGVAA